jgi:hypothetical protein
MFQLANKYDTRHRGMRSRITRLLRLFVVRRARDRSLRRRPDERRRLAAQGVLDRAHERAGAPLTAAVHFGGRGVTRSVPGLTPFARTLGFFRADKTSRGRKAVGAESARTTAAVRPAVSLIS